MTNVLYFNDMGVCDSVDDPVVSHSQLPIPFPIAVERITCLWVVYQLVQCDLKSSSKLGGHISDITRGPPREAELGH